MKSRPTLLGRFAWTLLLASVAGFFACRTGTTPTKRIVQKPIEQVRLLDRMAGTNPIRSDAEALPEPDPATSRVVKLQLRDGDDQLVEIEMVQSLSWLQAFDAKIGGTIDLDLPEVGAVGEATLMAIEPCPPIPPGRGNLVTALFKHHAKQALNLHVANSTEPIGVTPNHPIWSEDREAFVPAGQLQPGERLRTRTGESTTIVKVMPRPGPEPVFNLQVHGEHVYRVGTSGLLVHNKAMPNLGQARQLLDDTPRIVIGETMARVDAVADTLGAVTYQGPPDLLLNRIWLINKIEEGHRVFDIGMNAARSNGRSIFYGMEQRVVRDHFQLSRELRGTVTGSNGQLYPVFEWVWLPTY